MMNSHTKHGNYEKCCMVRHDPAAFAVLNRLGNSAESVRPSKPLQLYLTYIIKDREFNMPQLIDSIDRHDQPGYWDD